ncbi:spore germination protein KC [Caloranaerobacter azorensis DSM 13643]|uniref:Spore germination protein KC n=1 Tax=Caloranaerobacter azorensis DSM 13643 TaxID=1121264 RepID=A0A1M5UR29_9FIRM|nr:Ger(x)C family spore germination protein [Caloranaerobacter azorensis]SHH65278.1 spore germination protein KC [Caloranaerobacter azorensis DSM 13643]
MIKINKILILLLMIIFNVVIFTACWDNKDLTEKAFVTAVGVDRTAEGKVQLTLQIVKPTVMKAGEQGIPEEEAFWVFTTVGDTIFEAAKNQMTAVNRKPFYNHADLMVIGEEFARDGIMDALDFWERNHEPRLGSDIIIAKGTTAEEILKAKSDMEKIPSLHIKSILKNSKELAKVKKVTIIDVLKQLIQPGVSPAIGAIEIVEKEDLQKIEDMKIDSTAVFKGDKLVGWLNAAQTRGLLFIQNEVRNAVYNVDNPLNKNKKVAIEILDSNGKIDAQIVEWKLILSIKIDAVGNIADQQGKGDLTTKETFKKLSRDVENAIKTDIKDVLSIAQKEYKSDIFGFGEVMYRRHFEYWKQIKDDWADIFSNASIEIDVNVKIRGTGIIGKPSEVR